MSQAQLMHPLEGVRLQANRPIVGVDLSTVRASACILERGDGRRPTPTWSTQTLQTHSHMAMRVSLAQETIAGWLERIEADHGAPAAIGLEIPLAGPHTPLVSFWFVGAFISAVGDTFAASVPLVTMGPGKWKRAATGRGIAANLPQTPQGATKTERSRLAERRREIEKARLMAWARAVMGYPASASLQDEADAAGVAVATALQVAR